MEKPASSVHGGSGSTASASSKNTVSLQQKLKDACFRVLHDLAEDTNTSKGFLLLLWALDVISLLTLPLSATPSLPWASSPAMRGLWQFLSVLWFNPGAGEYFPQLGYEYGTLYGLIAAWMAAVLATFCWLMYVNLGYSDYYPRWMLVALRISARVAIHGLWGTIIMNLVDPFTCSSVAGATWRATRMPCWTGGHAAVAALSGILIPVALLYHVAIALTYVNREPDYNGKKNLLAAPHGRVEAAMLLLKAIMALFYVFAHQGTLAAAYLIPCLLAGLVWMYAYVRYQPYHMEWLNGVQISLAAVYTSACVCAILAASIDSASGGAQIGAVAFIFSLPLVLFVGWSVHAYYSKQYVTGVSVRGMHALELNDPFSLELRIRAILAESVRDGIDIRALAMNKAVEDYYSSTQHQAKAGGPKKTVTGLAAYVNAAEDAAEEKRHLLSDESYAAQQARQAERAAAVKAEVTKLFQQGSKSFSNNPMLYMFWANYQATVALNEHLERLMWKEATSKADWSAVDINFVAWSRNLTLSMKADAAGATKMNVERRMRYERLTVDSQEAVALVREHTLAFWTELSGKTPDLVKLQALGESINQGNAAAEQIFAELLALAPQNASLIRSYAEYLLELSNNPRKAQDLLADAEQLEDDASKAHAVASSREHSYGLMIQDFDLSADSVGTLRVSADRANLGVILEANLALCRIVGYSQRELVGRVLDDLCPEPISMVHNAIMERFMQVGETRFLGASRLSFVLHRGGYMICARVFVQPAGGDLHAVIDGATTPPGESYLWCFGSDAGWTMTAMCEATMNIMALDPSQLKAGAYSLSSFIHNVDEVFEQVQEHGMARAVIRRPQDRHHSAADFHVLVKAQHIMLPALGRPFWMVRFRRDSFAGVAETGGKNASRDEDSGSVSTGVSDDVQGSGSDQQGVPHKASPARAHPGTAAPRAPGQRVSGEQFKEHAGDIALCPVMGGGSGRTAGPVSSARGAGGTDTHVTRLTSSSTTSAQPRPDTGTPSLPGAVDVSPGKADATPNAALDDVMGALGLNSSSGGEDGVVGPAAAAATQASAGLDNAAGNAITPTAGKAKKKMTFVVPDDHKGDSFLELEQAQEGTSPAAAPPVPAQGGGELVVNTAPHHNHHQHERGQDSGHRLHSALKHSHSKGMDSSEGDALHHPPAAAHRDHHSHHSASTGPHKAGHGDDHHGHGGAGSVHSKSSGASSNSITDVVRRGVLSKSGKLEGSLRTLRWAVLVTFAVTASLNIAALLVTSGLVGQMIRNLELVEMNGRRSVLAQRLYSNVQTWRAAALGLADPPNMEYERVRNDVYLKTYTALNEELYLAVDGSLPEESDVYTNGSAITVNDYKNGTRAMQSLDFYETTTRTLNLANAASELATRTRSLLALNYTQILFVAPADETKSTYWICENGPSSLRVAMNRSLMLADARSETQGTMIKASDVVILAVSETLFFMVIVVAIVPAVFNVAKSRQAVFQVFIAVPLPIVRALKATVQKRIDAIQRAEDENDVGVDIAGAGSELDQDDDDADLKALLKQSRANGFKSGEEDEDAGAELKTAVNAAMNASAAAQAASQGPASTAGSAAPMTKAAQRKAKAVRKYKRAGSAVLSTLLAFSWPVVAYMAYFAVMWWYKGTVVDVAGANRAQVLWSTQAELYIRLSSIRLRFAYTFCDPTYMAHQLDLAERNMIFTDVLLDQLLYGAAERGLPPGLQESGAEDYKALWLGNACSRSEGWYYDYNDCLAFRSGLLTRGLLGTVSTYHDIGRKLIAARRQFLNNPACAMEHVETAGTLKADMSVLGVRYLASGFERATAYQFTAARNYLISFQQTYQIIVAISIIMLLILWTFAYAPHIQHLDKDIKHVRLLLLLFPDEVARSVPAIVAAGKQLLAEAGSSGGSAASGAGKMA